MIRKIDLYRVDRVKGSNITATSTTSNKTINRNSSCFRKSTIDLQSNSGLNCSFEAEIDHLVDCQPSTTSTGFVENVSAPVVNQDLVVRRIQPSRNGKGEISRLQIDPSKKTYS